MKIKICPDCKTENKIQASVCKKCRFDLTSVAVKSVKPEGKKKIILKTLPIVIYAILVGFILLFLIVHIAENRSEKASREILLLEKEITRSRAFLNAVRKSLPEAEKKKYAKMVYIPAGEFTMGSNSGYSYENPPHKVHLNAYYMDKYEVTFNQYDKYCRATRKKRPSDSGFGRGNRPVINVNWNEAKAYCEHYGKRLPTEAEWEKAAKGGSDTKYCFGNNESELNEYAWHGSNLLIEFMWHFFLNSGYKIHFVGTKKPNNWGLYDMHGNVWEWCNDWYDENYYSAAAKRALTKNPKGPDKGNFRVLRGGCWLDRAYVCRSANRFRNSPVFRSDIFGFRCAASDEQ